MKSSSSGGGPSSTNNNISQLNSSSLSTEFERVKKKLQVKMDLVFETCLAQDTDFPIVDSPIWVFGRSYSIHYGKDKDGKGQLLHLDFLFHVGKLFIIVIPCILNRFR